MILKISKCSVSTCSSLLSLMEDGIFMLFAGDVDRERSSGVCTQHLLSEEWPGLW